MRKSRVAADVNSKRAAPKPNPRWGREEETEIFAQKVRLFRQGKISDDDFRRFRLQHEKLILNLRGRFWHIGFRKKNLAIALA